MSRPIWWPIAIVLLALAAELAVLADAALPVRAGVTFVFLLVGPGMAFVRLLGVRGPVVELVLAIALSMTLETLLAEGMMLTRTWSAGTALTVLIVLTVVGAVLQLAASRGATEEGVGE